MVNGAGGSGGSLSGHGEIVMSPQEKWHRKEESHECELIAEREGDRLLNQGDLAGAEVAHRIAARIRIRRDKELEAF